jgi:outer membrane protein insertion porin family
VISSVNVFGKRAGALLLVGTILGGWSAPLLAQSAAPAQAPASQNPQPATGAAAQPAATTQPAPAPAQAQAAPSQLIRSIAVRGNQRLEPETIRAYANLAPGQTYTAESLDQALKDLYATELFADVVISGADTGNIVITVRENPVINRIVLEGNRRIKEDKILPEIRLKPREIFTRSKVLSDVERIVELYKRQGRFAAQVEPKIVQLDQNRVDLVFEIYEGDTSKVRAINIIGNEAYSDDRLRKEMFTREAGGILGFLRSNDTYDPDRLAADQQKLRAFYLTQGYADFRVVSALAELTPDRRDFVITYVIEEGPRYRFGTIEAESALRDFQPETIKGLVGLKSGEWFDAKAVEDSVTTLSEFAGALGYAFASISPSYDRNVEQRVMNVTFRVDESARTYVERIDIQGNTATRDKVVRREFRINEGDAFNAIKVSRSRDRIQSLGFFQENLEIKQAEGSSPDRVVLSVDVEERSTGELSLSAGYSSLEQFIFSFNIAQRNFMGKGQELNAGLNYSRYSKSVQLGFVEPYLFDRSILLGADIYRRDYSSFNLVDDERNRTYSQVSTGGGLRLGFPVTEYLTVGTRYNLVLDEISLDEDLFFSDLDDDGDEECDPSIASQYLCDELGSRTTSLLGYSVVFDNTNALRATRGQRLTLSQDFAGLGGDVRYVRTRGSGTKYWSVFDGWTLSAHLEGGYIHPLESSPGPGRDAIRITDRFFGAQLRGFDIRGIGPRILRTAITYDEDGNAERSDEQTSDALGGRAYYMGRLELEMPLSASLRSLGLRPSAFVDVGSVFSITKPNLIAVCTLNVTGVPLALQEIIDVDDECPANYRRTLEESFAGDTASPRLAVGVGVNWNSPFGPFRLDLARALLKEEGDDTKIFSFNVGTRF